MHEKKFGKLYFSYEGSTKNDIPWGKGIIRYRNGDIYSGEIKNDTESGFGFLKFSENDSVNRSSYFGNFKEGMRNGFGTFYWKDGGVHVGYFDSDLRNGEGSYSFKFWILTVPLW